MFPLGTVVMPGVMAPLHVFEERYRAMVRDCLTMDEPAFGIVLIRRGPEVGGGDERCDVGTEVRMLKTLRLEDGRYALVAGGARRIRVVQWLEDAPYPQALVEDWPDEDEADSHDAVAARLPAARDAVRRCLALATELGDRVPRLDTEIVEDGPLATLQLSALAPLELADHQRLLEAPGALHRLLLLDELLAGRREAFMARLGAADGAGGETGDDRTEG
jgi:Lon protease-like protein